MPAPPSPEELGPLIAADTAALDMPTESYEEPDGEFMSAARAAVGGDAKARALKDAMEACLREHGLIGGGDEEAAELDAGSSDVGEGFEDL